MHENTEISSKKCDMYENAEIISEKCDIYENTEINYKKWKTGEVNQYFMIGKFRNFPSSSTFDIILVFLKFCFMQKKSTLLLFFFIYPFHAHAEYLYQLKTSDRGLLTPSGGKEIEHWCEIS